jgi:hypothetical protein
MSARCICTLAIRNADVNLFCLVPLGPVLFHQVYEPLDELGLYGLEPAEPANAADRVLSAGSGNVGTNTLTHTWQLC